MLSLPPRKFLLSPSSKSSRVIVMVSMNLLLLKSPAAPAAYTRIHSLYDCSSPFSSSSRTFLFEYYSRNISRLIASPKHLYLSYQRTSSYSHTPHSALPVPRPISGVDVEILEKQFVDDKQLMVLRQKLQEIGIDGSSCMPGQYNGLSCPSCKGGEKNEKSFSLHITVDGGAAMWTCFRAKCGWKGTTGLLAYFDERMISGETLQRNDVMQKRKGDQVAIAFTYRRNGELVSCKYHDLRKRFWQEANTEKIFYGLDDIKDASDIIIVEGEMDKLAMEEAGFKNCVSVPDGAPTKLSDKALPAEEQDTRYQYLWNCKDYTSKASRIILATDGDAPGQALAEELARRLGKERCWKVKWPKKNETEILKDANEVLVCMGSDALREVIENAELYPR